MDGQTLVTILTPTYNRAHQITNLYDSLCSQKDKRFVWCVVDDGSDDNTEEVLKSLIQKASFPITYLKKENGGKHTALNKGISVINTPLVFIVDSDDRLTCDAVSSISEVFADWGSRESLCGFSFLRMFPDGKINGKPFKKDMWEETYINARINSYDMLSDKAEVYKTKCLKEFPFPEFQNEKFLGEDVVWIRMARKYKTLHVNKAIYVGEYQSDGLTKNRRRHNLDAPNGCVARAREYLEKDICLKARIKGYLQYLIYGMTAKCSIKTLLSDVPDKPLCLMLILPALMVKISWGRKI